MRSDPVAAIKAGAAAADRGRPRADNPYRGALAEYWLLGHDLRTEAEERHNSYPDLVDRELAEASRYLDEGADQSTLAPSKRIALLFYSLGSIDPDEAWRLFQARMAEARRRYAAGFYADPTVATPVPRAAMAARS